MPDQPKLETLPEESKPSDLLVVVRSLSQHRGLATRELYEQVMRDRPTKFNTDQVGFARDAGDEQMNCGACFHYFTGKVAQRSTCEIFRPEEDESIRPKDRCRFFTVDGKTFPLLPESETD